MQKFIYLCLALVSMSLFSCSNDEPDMPETPDDNLGWFDKNGNFDINLYNASIMDSAWYHNSSHAERCLALNIPEDILPTLTTEQLVYATMRFPFNCDFILWDNPHRYIYWTLSNYNAYSEALTRKDFREAFVDYFCTSKLLAMGPHLPDSYEGNRWDGMAEGVLFLILDQDIFVDNMSKDLTIKAFDKTLEYYATGLFTYHGLLWHYLDDQYGRVMTENVVETLIERLQLHLDSFAE